MRLVCDGEAQGVYVKCCWAYDSSGREVKPVIDVGGCKKLYVLEPGRVYYVAHATAVGDVVDVVVSETPGRRRWSYHEDPGAVVWEHVGPVPNVVKKVVEDVKSKMYDMLFRQLFES